MRSNEYLLKNLTVLYVEDDLEVREQMTLFLKKRVGHLLTATDGDEGLTMFKKASPDLIISDLQMPKMDGLTMSKKIRSTSSVPIIITTAYSEKETLLDAIDTGVISYILKPIDASELITALEKAAMIIFREKGSLTRLKQMNINASEKAFMEEYIRNAFAKIIKDTSGKGPRYVKAFLHGETLEIEIANALTKMELTLSEVESHLTFIKFNRELFYKALVPKISEVTREQMGLDCQFSGFEMDFIQDIQKVTFDLIG